jgi:LacI family transcriptional regulator
MISLRQLARIAGVSRTTVMRAFQQTDGIAEDTRRRILALAEEYDYAPLVRSKDARRSARPIIGCLVPGILMQGDALFVETVALQCMKRQCDMLFRETTNKLVLTKEALDYYLLYPVNGILVHSGITLPLPDNTLAALAARKIPVVRVDVTLSTSPLDWVGPNEIAVGETAVRYLAGLGHRRIGYVGVSSQFDIVGGRPLGVRNALIRRGLATDLFIDVQYAEFHDALAQALHAPNRPTALIVQDDMTALHAIAVLHHLGIDVPHQISVMGVGDYPFAPITYPPLTTISLRQREVSLCAIDLLFERMANPITPTADTVRQIAVEPQLIERASCVHPMNPASG